jgi:hypothetical protein
MFHVEFNHCSVLGEILLRVLDNNRESVAPRLQQPQGLLHAHGCSEELSASNIIHVGNNIVGDSGQFNMGAEPVCWR